jgi:hypothetical protein
MLKSLTRGFLLRGNSVEVCKILDANRLQAVGEIEFDLV